METQPNGSLCFRQDGKPIFIFDKQSYDYHCERHSLLKEGWFLGEVEKALFEPDVISQGLKSNIRIYYRVYKSHNKKYNISVWAVRIPVVYRHNKRGKEICFIKSAHDRQGFADQIVPFVEDKNRLWTSP